jgi:hypothetical protein
MVFPLLGRNGQRIFGPSEDLPQLSDNLYIRLVSFFASPPGDEGVGCGNQHLRQHSAGTFARKFGQWIVDVTRLTEGNNTGIS